MPRHMASKAPPADGPSTRKSESGLTPKKLLALARKRCESEAGVDASISVTDSKGGPPGSLAFIVETEDADYKIRVEPALGRGYGGHGWIEAYAYVKESDEPMRWLTGSQLTKDGWGDVWSAIVASEKLLAQEREFAGGWDSLDDAHAARLTAMGG